MHPDGGFKFGTLCSPSSCKLSNVFKDPAEIWLLAAYGDWLFPEEGGKLSWLMIRWTTTTEIFGSLPLPSIPLIAKANKITTTTKKVLHDFSWMYERTDAWTLRYIASWLVFEYCICTYALADGGKPPLLQSQSRQKKNEESCNYKP